MSEPAGEERVGLDSRTLAVLALAALLALGAAVWVIRNTPGGGPPSPSIAAEGWTIDRAQVVTAARPDALPPLVSPRLLSVEEAAAFKIGRRGKYLVAGDLVLGVALASGEACAYPVRVLEWHEVVLHELGGVPLAVTYHPLSGCAAAFDRRLPGRAAPLDLRASGVLWQSTQLLFDAGVSPTSLWSQVTGLPVAGPAAREGAALRRVAVDLTHWGDWVVRHPGTRVIAPDPARADKLKHSPYGSYLGNDLLRFPVDPAPPAGGLPNKARVLAVEAGGEVRVYPHALLAEKTGPEGGEWTTEQGGVALTFRYLPAPTPQHEPAATARAAKGSEAVVVPCFWFAWYATHGGAVRVAGE